MSNPPQKIGAGNVVTFRYTLTGPDGVTLDESGEEGMPYLHGQENIVPGLERAMEGHGVGATFRTIVAPEDGYGPRLGPTQKIPRSTFPDDVEIEAGMQFFAQGKAGEPVPIWVVGLAGDEVEVDPNHPLAGIPLTFDVEVVDIRDATAEELEHGHPHGDDDDHHHHH